MTAFDAHIMSCFDSALNPGQMFGFGFNACAPYATTAETVPSTVGDVADYNDICDDLLPAIEFTRT